MHTRRNGIAVGALVFCLAACVDTPSAPPLRQPTAASRAFGNPPPPPVEVEEANACDSDQECVEVPCPLGDGDCFELEGQRVKIFVNPPSTLASLEFLSQPDMVIADGATVNEALHGPASRTALRGDGNLSVFVGGTWLSIDMTSMHGSLLNTTGAGSRSIILEADAYLPTGERYARMFLYQLTIP